MRSHVGCIVLTALLLAGCTTSPRDLEREAGLTVAASTAWVVTSAVCVISPTAGNQVKGVVTLERVADEIVRVVADISGLPPNSEHGFHIHEYGDLTASDASTAGSHYAPERGQRHGAPEQAHKHAGDLGNVVANGRGEAHLELSVHGISLSEENPVLGRAIILHAEKDDLRSQPSGNSGARIGAGVIGIATP
jgi:superoxide dismutase, Cu-Zn family